HAATLRLARDLRVWLFAGMLALSPGQLSRLRTGDLLARLMDDIDAVDGLLVRALGPLLALGLASLALAGFAFVLDPLLGGWIALAVAASAVLVPWRVARGQQDDEAGRALARADLRARLHELYEGAADLTAMDAARHRLWSLTAQAQDLSRRERRRRLRAIDGSGLHGVVGAAGWVGLLWLACGAVVDGRVDPAQAAGLAFAALALSEIGSGAALAWQALQAARASMQRVDALAGQAPAIADPPHPRALPADGPLVF